MAKVANTQPPTDLPTDVLSRLDPELRDLYSQLHPDLASRISVLLRGARSRRLHPNRVLKYAFLYATAERLAQSNAVSKEHTRRSKLELAGQIHGLKTGYRDDAEATQQYRRGRRARQQIQASLDAPAGTRQVFEQVVEQHRSELPEHVQSRFSSPILSEVGKTLHRMRIATTSTKRTSAAKRVASRIVR